jgi:hypothetical protein
MKRLQRLSLLAGAFALAFAFAPSKTKALIPVDLGDDDIIVTGCIVRGDSEGDEGLLLAQALPVASGATSGQALGTTGDVRESGQTLYWLSDLEDDDNLPHYIGRRVEIRGELEGDVKTGEMELERDGEWVKVEIKSDGKRVKTRLPLVALIPANAATGAVGTTGEALPDDEELELNVLVRKIDVKDVRVVAGSCDVAGG